MFVLLSKTLDLLLAPLTWALLCFALALVWVRRPRRAAAALGGGVAVILLFGAPSMGNALTRWTEAGVQSTYDPSATYDAAIVLGGGLDAVVSQQTGQLEFNGAVERTLQAFTLLREGKAQKVLLSGGLVFPREGVPAEAVLQARGLQAWGIAPERILQETKSRNTWENAVESARVIEAQGWRKLLLITSAAHLPRAAGCFRAQGLTFDVLAVDHRGAEGVEGGLLPRASGLDASTNALRELVGRLVYRLKGYTRPQ